MCPPCRGWLFSACGPGAHAPGFSMCRSCGAWRAWGAAAGCSWGAWRGWGFGVWLPRSFRGWAVACQAVRCVVPGEPVRSASRCCVAPPGLVATGPCTWGSRPRLIDVSLLRSLAGAGGSVCGSRGAWRAWGVRCVAPAGASGTLGLRPGLFNALPPRSFRAQMDSEGFGLEVRNWRQGCSVPSALGR